MGFDQMTILYILIRPDTKMCLGQKPFNSLPFPAIWRDLRQMLSLAVAVWGSQENKLRSLFFKGRLCFSAVLCFEGLTV